jgi:kynurenine formamidase
MREIDSYPKEEKMGTRLAAGLAATLLAAVACSAWSQTKVPAPPWPAGDERGMANAIGPATWARCAQFLSQPKARVYELSHPRSNTMPLSPFSGPYQYKYNPTTTLPGTIHAFNGEALAAGAEPGAQGTQMDALGHFAYRTAPWDGKSQNPAADAHYYGGHTQQDVKPTADSPLLKLGIEKAPPIITSAVLLDAKAAIGKGAPMKPGQAVTAKDIQSMLKAQGLASRGILSGDVVYVYTGWGDFWKDPDTEKRYYANAPGLSYDAAKYLGGRRVVAVGLDTPFIDPVNEGQLQGKAGPAEGTPPATPFAVHHQLITQSGIHHIESANLGELARDKVWTSCTMVLALRERGAAGSPVRPVAIGVPRR